MYYYTRDTTPHNSPFSHLPSFYYYVLIQTRKTQEKRIIKILKSKAARSLLGQLGSAGRAESPRSLEWNMTRRGGRHRTRVPKQSWTVQTRMEHSITVFKTLS
jgi:hypothetical protein